MSNLYEVLQQLCSEQGITFSRLAKMSGVSAGILYDLQAGRKKTVTLATAQKLATALGVPVQVLTGEAPPPSAQTPAPAPGQVSPELLEVLDYYKNKPGMRLLFSVTKDATPEDIIATAELIEELKRKRDKNE